MRAFGLARDTEQPLTPTPTRRVKAGVGRPAWLVTFVDLVSLLLAFFVMLFSMSSPSDHKWEEFTDAMRRGFAVGVAKPTEPEPERTMTAERPGRGFDLGYLRRVLEAGLSRAPELETAVLREVDGRLVISLPSDLFFVSGSDDVTDVGRRAVLALSETLSNIKNRIDVVGHTDPRPITVAGDFISNWELSLARATAVGTLFLESGYRKPLSMNGVAATRFAEIDPALDLDTRYRLARRVDLVVFPEKSR